MYLQHLAAAQSPSFWILGTGRILPWRMLQVVLNSINVSWPQPRDMFKAEQRPATG